MHSFLDEVIRIAKNCSRQSNNSTKRARLFWSISKRTENRNLRNNLVKLSVAIFKQALVVLPHGPTTDHWDNHYFNGTCGPSFRPNLPSTVETRSDKHKCISAWRIYLHRGLTFFIERVEKERERPQLTFTVVSPPGIVTINSNPPIEVRLIGVVVDNKSRSTVKDCKVALVALERPWIKFPAFWIGRTSNDITPSRLVEGDASSVIEVLHESGSLVPAMDLDPTDSCVVVVALGMDSLPNKVYLASDPPKECPSPSATRDSYAVVKIRIYAENFHGLESSPYAINLRSWDRFQIRRVGILHRRKARLAGFSS